MTRGLRAGDSGVDLADFTGGLAKTLESPASATKPLISPWSGVRISPSPPYQIGNATDRWPLAEPEDRGFRSLTHVSAGSPGWNYLCPLGTRASGDGDQGTESPQRSSVRLTTAVQEWSPPNGLRPQSLKSTSAGFWTRSRGLGTRPGSQQWAISEQEFGSPSNPAPVGGQKAGGSWIVHPPGMLELVVLLLGAVRAGLRSRADLAAENLLLRHQLAVVARPTRKRPPLRSRDKLLWILARRLCPDWRRHLVLVPPETVVRWHRQAWRLVWRWRSRPASAGRASAAETREPDRADGAREPALGQRADPRGAAQAGDRRQQPLDPPLPRGESGPTTEPDLADLPGQSPPRGSGRPTCSPSRP